MDVIIKDQKDMINYLHKQAEQNVKTREMLIEMNQELENEITEKVEVIQNLTSENLKLRSAVENTKGREAEVDILVKEIEEIKNLNRQKEDILAAVIKEKEILEENLDDLFRENKKLRDDASNKDKEILEEFSLGDELRISNVHNVSPMCEETNLKTHNEKSHSLVKKVWKLKLIQLEKSIISDKLKLTSDLLCLKEKECLENKNLGCACKYFCRIVHAKHTWKK